MGHPGLGVRQAQVDKPIVVCSRRISCLWSADQGWLIYTANKTIESAAIGFDLLSIQETSLEIMRRQIPEVL
jgi:hypothetical protein